jgi:uncharacterized membrane protein SpoIIM required for sporulation/uncharacterized RDD family membrane protein YckC
MAFVIDWLLRATLAAVWYTLAALAFNALHGAGFTLGTPANEPIGWYFSVPLPTLAIYFFYHPLLEVLMAGRTPGKRRAGIRIVTRGGAVPSAGALLLRNVFRLIDFFPGMYGVGLLSVAASREHLRVGDLAAGTVVAYARLPARVASAANAATAAAAVAAMPLAASDDLLRPLSDYRRLAGEVALAPADEALASRYAQAHAELFRPSWSLRDEARQLFGERIPLAMRWLRPYLTWVVLLFLLAAAAGWWLVHRYPDLARLFASQEMISAVERGELWTDGMLNIVPSSVMSVQLFTNNIVVSLFAFVAGFMFGLGTFYIVGINGMMLGAIFALCGQHGMDGRLFEFVVAHGLVELSCICLSGAAGAAVGEALLRPRDVTRAASFAAACARAADVLFAVVLLLVGCGLIEGFVSPDPDMPLATRLIVGVGYFFFMVALLRGWLAGSSRTALPASA